eukprot:scaffold100_cov229-Chaetoceros_neogracile.AAC.2
MSIPIPIHLGATSPMMLAWERNSGGCLFLLLEMIWRNHVVVAWTKGGMLASSAVVCSFRFIFYAADGADGADDDSGAPLVIECDGHF